MEESKTISILIKVPKELNTFLLDEVARHQMKYGQRTSKEAVIINLITNTKNNGN